MTWWQALIAAGAVPGSGGKGDEPGAADHADLVEGSELTTHPVGDHNAQIPAVVSFLNGIERWHVVAYDGVAQVVSAFVAAACAAARQTRRPAHERRAQPRLAIAPLQSMSPALRQILEQSGADVEPMDGALAGQPPAISSRSSPRCGRVRAHLEREIAEACIDKLGGDEWLVLDGLLSRSPSVARHPRAWASFKSPRRAIFGG